MRRTLLDVPSIVALYNVRIRKHVLTKLYSTRVWFKGNVFKLYRTSHLYLNQFSQINFQVLSKSLIQKPVTLMNCFICPFFRNCLISIYFGMNYKPINKNDHETDAFDHSKQFCAL
jgi:hypothetical protein